jgi:hypothetical protein
VSDKLKKRGGEIEFNLLFNNKNLRVGVVVLGLLVQRLMDFN